MGRLRMRIQNQSFLALSWIIALINSQFWDAFLGIGRVIKECKTNCTQSCQTAGVNTESDNRSLVCKGLEHFW